MVKAIFSTCRSSIIAASTCLKTTLVHFSLYSQTALEKFLSLMKEAGCLPPLAGKSPDSTVSPNQRNNSYGSQHSKNTEHSSLNSFLMEWYSFLHVFYKALYNAGKYVFFLKPGTWGLMAKELFSNCERSIVAASVLLENHTSSLLYSL